MEHKCFIDKDAVVAEIKKRLNAATCDITWLEDKGRYDAYDSILSFLDTLEVKEVDVEKVLSDLDKDIKEFVTTEEFEKDSSVAGHYWAIAKHAFLLGFKAQKGE